MRRVALCTALLLAACSDARDLFRPYVPNRAEVGALLARPWPVQRFDVALVLGCPADYDGAPSLCQRCRVHAAVDAYRRGNVSRILFSGGAAHSATVEADVMAEEAARLGVPREHLLREGNALTTWQNMRFSLQKLDALGLRTVLVVSTATHLPRARRIAHFFGLGDDRAGYCACDVEKL